MMKKLLTILLALVSAYAIAQTGTIRGTVFEDASGLSIIGGNIAIKKNTDPSFDNSITGTVTDLDGAFTFILAPGMYDLQISYVGYETLTVQEVEVKEGEVTSLETIRMGESVDELQEVVVTAKAIRTSEIALLTVKKKSAVMMDGISSAKFKLTGDATAVEAAKRVTGVSIEGGKYVYVRGLGDRYSKTTLNQVDVPGLDPDMNTIQLDIFPTNLIDNIIVSKNFTADMPADFTGGLLNIETKAFPEEKIFDVSVSTTINPDMHFNSDYLTYEAGGTDFLGFDDGTRELPSLANRDVIPTPLNSQFTDQQINDFNTSFNPQLGVDRETSLLDFSASLSLGNQIDLKGGGNSSPKFGYIFSASYKSGYTYYDDYTIGEFQRSIISEEYEMVPAAVQEGQVGGRSTLIGLLGGIAYKTKLSKFRLTAMHLQSGESRASQFNIDDCDCAVGHSGFLAVADNLEYNQRSLSNLLLNGTHVIKDSGWEVDWRLSPTLSISEDPDIRNTAFTLVPNGDGFLFNAGAGGLPTRIWRSLEEINAVAKVDVTKKYQFKDEDAKLKFGASHTYKDREYEILLFDLQAFGSQPIVDEANPNSVLDGTDIFPNGANFYIQSGNNSPNPNQYESNVNNTGFYVSNEFNLLPYLKAILGVRAENFVQRHTGRDQSFASGGDGRNLDNDKVLESLDFFPSANLIYSLTENQNLRGSYSRTIARPSFKELSFAQILDPVSNRIFNGSLFPYEDWDGILVETNIDNFDIRWELFQKGGQLFSVSGFYKRFNNPIELVRIPQQLTSTEYQPRNVGDGQLFGIELEVRKNLEFLSGALKNFSISTNLTFVESIIDMADAEFEARKGFEKPGQTIEDTRDMAGQSPYVINAGLSYNDPEAGLQAGLFYNVKGPTLFIVGGGLFPDIYTQPFHNVNFSIAKKLGEEGNTTIDLKVSNILADRIESFYQAFRAEDQIFDSFNPGRAFSLGLSHKF